MTTNHTTERHVIEHRLLELAYTTDVKITGPALAYFVPCSIEDAEQVLESLAGRGRITMEVGDDGSIVYQIPDRQKLQPRVEAAPPRAISIVPVSLPFAIRGGRQASPGVAALLSLVIPGAGQLYAGRFVSAILWFLFVTAGYALILPGIFLHLMCIGAAAGAAYRLNSSLVRYQLQTTASS
jgi:TM2 domain-containing membrane protein YozV